MSDEFPLDPAPAHNLPGAGILILVQPSLLNDIVASYLIIVGVLGLAPHFLQ